MRSSINITKTCFNVHEECCTMPASIDTLCKCAATLYQLRAALEKTRIQVLYVTLSDQVVLEWAFCCHTYLCPAIWISLALLLLLDPALLPVQVQLIRACATGSMQPGLNKTWGEFFNQERASALSEDAGTSSPAIHHMCPHTNDKPKRRHRATSFHNQSVFIHDMSIN